MAFMKDEIVDATIGLIAEMGLGEFSMKMVTDKIGCSEALMYKEYKTKEGLLQACFDRLAFMNSELIGKDLDTYLAGYSSKDVMVKVAAKILLRTVCRNHKASMFHVQVSNSRYSDIAKRYEANMKDDFVLPLTRKLKCEEEYMEYEDKSPGLFVEYIRVFTSTLINLLRTGDVPDEDSTYTKAGEILISGLKVL